MDRTLARLDRLHGGQPENSHNGTHRPVRCVDDSLAYFGRFEITGLLQRKPSLVGPEPRSEVLVPRPQRQCQRLEPPRQLGITAVSYTHLTLPTKRIV